MLCAWTCYGCSEVHVGAGRRAHDISICFQCFVVLAFELAEILILWLMLGQNSCTRICRLVVPSVIFPAALSVPFSFLWLSSSRLSPYLYSGIVKSNCTLHRHRTFRTCSDVDAGDFLRCEITEKIPFEVISWQRERAWTDLNVTTEFIYLQLHRSALKRASAFEKINNITWQNILRFKDWKNVYMKIANARKCKVGGPHTSSRSTLKVTAASRSASKLNSACCGISSRRRRRGSSICSQEAAGPTTAKMDTVNMEDNLLPLTRRG